MARGQRHPRYSGYLAILVRFDEPDFYRVRDYASRHRMSFAEAVRMFCVWGLETANVDKPSDM